MLLNIDKPTRRAIVHSRGSACPHVPRPYGTEYKFVGRMGRDGGWFEVATFDAAAAVTRREAPGFEARPCDYCGR